VVPPVHRGKVKIFGKFEYDSPLDVFEIRIGISDIQETSVLYDLQVQTRGEGERAGIRQPGLA